MDSTGGRVRDWPARPAHLEILRWLVQKRPTASAVQLAVVAGPFVEDRKDLVAGIGHQADIDPGHPEIAEPFQRMTGGCGFCAGFGHVMMVPNSTSSP